MELMPGGSTEPKNAAATVYGQDFPGGTSVGE